MTWTNRSRAGTASKASAIGNNAYKDSFMRQAAIYWLLNGTSAPSHAALALSQLNRDEKRSLCIARWARRVSISSQALRLHAETNLLTLTTSTHGAERLRAQRQLHRSSSSCTDQQLRRRVEPESPSPPSRPQRPISC
ncbi:hypothetical protein HGRIS_011180 [Hohenbuehelia grisea]|uniref:Uncharacterized protein n=1 Tax=Hohenbuehelia grisea TaxID=104357 RepID=A0ABR3JW97_9AGAR